VNKEADVKEEEAIKAKVAAEAAAKA